MYVDREQITEESGFDEIAVLECLAQNLSEPKETRASPQETVIWILKRIQSILRAPLMWGCLEAVELQLLQLLEMYWFINHPKSAERAILNLYGPFLEKRFPRKQKLYKLVKEDPEQFVTIFREFLEFLWKTEEV